MSTELYYALWITVIGMSLVFGAILLLWVVMAVLVRFTADRPSENEALSQNQPPVQLEEASLAAARKRRAAVAAVAVALAHQADSTLPHEFPLPPPAVVSAWQAVARSRTLSIRGSKR
jgi:sodium pump decarboxylase gamma subunit